MLDWLWTYWSPTSAFLYISGAMWVMSSFGKEPLTIDGTWCRWCELGCVIIWPVLMPLGIFVLFVKWLREKLGYNRTYL